MLGSVPIGKDDKRSAGTGSKGSGGDVHKFICLERVDTETLESWDGGQGSGMVKQGPAGWRSWDDGWVRGGTSRVSLLNCETEAYTTLLLEGQ